MSSDLIAFSIHPTIHNKPPQWQPEFASGWQQRDGTLEDLRAHVTAGGAFIAAAMSSEHRSSSAFKYADLAVVDVDHGLDLDAFRAHPLSAHACFVYTTYSHTPEKQRYRILFRLPARLNDPDAYKALVTLLTTSLGGDKSCTDPCRLFYGADTAEVPLWQPEAILPEGITREARINAELASVRARVDASHYDDSTVGQAIYALENVLRPTEDGERDRFIKITAAACSGGEALFPAWQNWASRCHHTTGYRAKQGTERYFYSFRNTRSSLTTIFYFATQDDPDWHDGLPAELKNTDYKPPKAHKAYGYEHEDYMLAALDDPFDDGSDLIPGRVDDDNTPGLFDAERPWAVVAQATATQSPPSPAVAPTRPLRTEDDDDEDFDYEPNPYFEDDDDYDAPVTADQRRPDDVLPRIPRRRGPGAVPEGLVRTIRDRLNRLYPGLRRNLMNQELEYGPLDAPILVDDITTAYCRISLDLPTTLPKQTVIDVAHISAWENRIHPVRSYLTHCLASCAPSPLFKTIASELLGLPHDPVLNPVFTRGPQEGRLFADVIMERFLVGAIARVMEPGCVHDWMPILVGSQNCGKSTFFQYLTPPSPTDPGSYPWASTIQQGIRTIKEKPHLLHAGWFVILDETERYFQRSYVEELKNMLSVSVDRSARKYENERNFPRAFVLCGATNSDDFFVDPTGNRRFMPIVVKGKIPSAEDPKTLIIDLDRVKQERDAIWAAAYQAYMDNPVHTFSSDELKQMKEYQENFCTDNPFEGRVRAALSMRHSGVYNGISYVALSDLYDWLEIPVDRHKSVQLPISDSLKHMGYSLKRVRIGGALRRIWLRPNPSETT